MTNFKQTLKYELKQDAPFTEELKQRLISGKKRTKKKSLVPFLTGGAIALFVMILFLFTNRSEQNVLLNAEDVPTDFKSIVEILEKTEVRLPLVKEIESNQMLYTDVDVSFNGKMDYYGNDHVVVESGSTYNRGDYLLFELKSGEQYVRQVLAFENETFEKKNGNLFIEGKQLVLPGWISTAEHNYENEENFYSYASYFIYKQNQDTLEMPSQILKKGELLVQANFQRYGDIQIIQDDQVIGKVVALEYFEPTFLLKGEEAEVFESFKKDHNVEKLVGLDPVTIVRMHVTALMERDVETLYAMTPSYAKIQETKEQFEQMVLPNTLEFTESEQISAMAYYYNGIENARVVIDESRADVYYTASNFNQTGQGIWGLIYNPRGFWELSYGQ